MNWFVCLFVCLFVMFINLLDSLDTNIEETYAKVQCAKEELKQSSMV